MGTGGAGLPNKIGFSGFSRRAAGGAAVADIVASVAADIVDVAVLVVPFAVGKYLVVQERLLQELQEVQELDRA